MKFYDKIFYNIRHIIPTIGITGLTMMPVACTKVDLREEKIPQEQKTDTLIVQHDVLIEFTDLNKATLLSLDTLQKYINDKTVGKIYLVPTNHWNNYYANTISAMRKNFLEPRMKMSDKLQGYGDFDFHLGAASRVPNDSLWFVENGWTINKQFQR